MPSVSMNAHPMSPASDTRGHRPLLLPTNYRSHIPVTFISLLWGPSLRVEIGCEIYGHDIGAKEAILVNHCRDLATGTIHNGHGTNLVRSLIQDFTSPI